MILCNYGCGEEAKYQLKNGVVPSFHVNVVL